MHLDGSGAVTFLVVVPAMLPLYEALGMDRRLLACAAAMAAGVMNVVPWGGPTLRAAAALELPVAEIFNPMLPLLAVGLLYVLGVSYVLGRREEKRLAGAGPGPGVAVAAPVLSEEQRSTRRPRLIWVNAILTLAVLGSLISELLPPAATFMIGAALALVVNYPDPALQRQRVDAHARAALMMASILLAAGVFTGHPAGLGDADGHGRRRRGAICRPGWRATSRSRWASWRCR